MTSSTVLAPPSFRAALAAHLVPGLVLFSLWLVGAPLLAALGQPPVLVLLLAVPAVLAPLVVIGVLRARNADAPQSSLRDFVGIRRLEARTVLSRVVPLGLAAAVLPAAAVPLEPVLRHGLSPWLPAWWDLGLPSAAGPLPLAAWLCSAVLLGPVLEEVWFRGVLQPRLPGSRVARVLLGAGLFTVYHLWQPWAWPTVLLTALPLAVLRETRAGTTGAVLVHVGVNALVLPLVLADWLQR